jgi:putative ABC transport system permease protein
MLRPLLTHLLLDLRQSLRSLTRTPGLTATIILTVGLGIGATTAIFAVIHGVLLSPLPYSNPGRLVRIYTDAPPNRFRFSVADYLALEQQQTTFRQVAGYASTSMTFNDGDIAERVTGRQVSRSYFSLLGIVPRRGRDFDQSEGTPGGPRAAIVSYGFAWRHLGGDSAAIGHRIRLDGVVHTVVGVLPRAVGPLEGRTDVFAAAQWSTPPRRGPFTIIALGRLSQSGDTAAATAELRAINRRIFPVWQSSYQDRKATWAIMDLKRFIIGDVGSTLAIVQGAVVFVLLIACTNAANLLVARVTRRRRELTVRSALGASHLRLILHLISETAILVLGGAVVAVAVAVGGIRLIKVAGAAFIPRSAEVGLTGPVIAFLAALTVGAGLVFGLIPALHGAAFRFAGIQPGGRSSTDPAGPRRLRRALVVAEFAVATPLLVAAGLLVASLARLQRVDLGIDRRDILTGAILLPREEYADSGRIEAFWREAEVRIAALPQIQGLAFSDGRPAVEVGNVNNFDFEDDPTPSGESQPTSPWVSISPDYFRLLGIPLERGRRFDNHDGSGNPVVIVDRTWVRRFSPDRDPIGRTLREGGCTDCSNTIVGVVGDVRYGDLDQPDPGTVYWPVTERPTEHPVDQITSRFRYLVIRTAGDPAATIPSIRRVIHDLDPRLPLTDVATIDELLDQSLVMPRYLSVLVAAFALVALLLSAIGIYGVMAYFVEQHSRDIGIRIALGGAPSMVSRMIVGQGMAVVGPGIALGLVVALAFTRFLSAILFEVGATDPRIFLGVSIVMLTIALAGCLLPARQAAIVDPATTLREE